MAWSQSFIPLDNILDALNNTVALALTADSEKVALYGSSFGLTINDSDLAYTATGEVTGTNWSAGGVALSSGALTAVSGTGVMFDAADVSVASTTISTSVYGCLIYDSQSGLANRGIVAVYFGGTGYTTNNGTFGIQWNAGGIFTIQLHP